MTRWFRRVVRSWRLQRQRRWLQQRQEKVLTPLVQYHLSAAKYHPRLERQRRRRRAFGGLGGGGGPVPLAAAAAALPNRFPAENHRLRRSPASSGARKLRRLWTAPRQPSSQRGRFVWNENKHPLLSSRPRLQQRARRQRWRRLRRRVEHWRRNRRLRPASPTLLPQPGAQTIAPERQSQWRRARLLGRRHW